jgi:DNA polymerase I - 3''-5'' exonuclease and polymerase domains
MANKVTVSSGDLFEEDKIQTLTGEKSWMKDRVFKCAVTLEEVRKFVDEAINPETNPSGKCVLDLETTGLNSRTKKEVSPENIVRRTPILSIVGFCVSYNSKFGLYIPIKHWDDPQKPEGYNLPQQEVLEEIRRLCQFCITIYHNAKFDLQFLKNYGITVNDYKKFEDTLLKAHLFDPAQKDNKLKHLSERLINQPMIEFADITGKEKRFDLLDPRSIGYIYGSCDGICTLDLNAFFDSKEIVTSQQRIYDIEKRVTLVVLEMESNLVKLNIPYLKELKSKTETRIKEIEKQIHDMADNKLINIASPQQLGKFLFDDKHYTYPEKAKTASGQYSTADATLEKIADLYPIVKRIMEYRGLDKILNTYINKLLSNYDEDECVKLCFNQSGTDTGRFSSPGGAGIDDDGYSGTNVQSIPKKPDEDNPWMDMRKAFIPRPGKTMVAADYENEEMRIATNYSLETKWIDAVKNNIDFHTTTGAIIAGGKDAKDVTSSERKLGKCVAKGTLIASEHGWLPIESLKKGDKVITHTGELKKITKVWSMGTKPGIAFNTTGGHKITCGLNHQFFTDRDEWIRAEDLKIGQRIRAMGVDLSLWLMYPYVDWIYDSTEIEFIKFINEVELMDLTIKDDHTYIAQGLVTHNTTNFLALYLGGPKSLAAKAKITMTEAKKVLTAFWDGVPKLKKWKDSEILKARKSKIVKTAFGRVRSLVKYYESDDQMMESHGDRCAINTQIQGSAADIMKIVMSMIYQWIHQNNLQDDVKLLITMHDELIFEITTEKLEEYVPYIARLMMAPEIIRDMLNWPVPLTVDVKYGESWRAKKTFFKDFPKAKEVLDEFLKLKVADLPIPSQSNPVQQEEIILPAPASVPLPETVQPELKLNIQLKQEIAPESKLEPTPIVQEEKKEDIVDKGKIDNKVLVYTIRDRRDVTLRRLNDIIRFFVRENKRGMKYTGPYKELRIRDMEGNNHSVDEFEVPEEVFKGLARFHEI